MIVYMHDEKGFDLTAYEKRIDGSLEPVAWLVEKAGRWFVFGYVSIHEYSSFAEVRSEIEKTFG